MGGRYGPVIYGNLYQSVFPLACLMESSPERLCAGVVAEDGTLACPDGPIGCSDARVMIDCGVTLQFWLCSHLPRTAER